MRKLVISALTVVAVGATFAGAKTARATEGWVSSGWVGTGYYTGASIAGPFTINVEINEPTSQLATISTAVTGAVFNQQFTNKTGNCTGTANNYTCPTTHWAFTLCSDNTFITGPMGLDYRTSPNQPATISNTASFQGGFGAGRWTPSWGPVGETTGYCSDLTNASWVAGGVWMYSYE